MLAISFNPFPCLESDRLILREITSGDVSEVFAMRSDPATMKYIPRPLARTEQDALDHIALIAKGLQDNESINWAITLRGDDRLVGMICLLRMQLSDYRTEIGYILHPDFHGKGIMDETIKTVIAYAFGTLKFHSLEAVIDPENAASEKVLVKNNFVKEAHFKENGYYDGRFIDSVIYSLINPDSPWK